MKICSVCKKEKLKTEFHRNKSKDDGRANICKICFKQYHIRNRDKKIKAASEWYKQNKDKKRIYDAEYRERTRSKRREASKKYRNNHPSRKRADCALRRCQKIKATPYWVDKEELRRIYENCPKGFQVDHIVPLNGKNVCGLHVPWNLQYLPAAENLKKANHYSFEK